MILDRIFGLGSTTRRTRDAALSAIEAARTNRLNADRWSDATDQPINAYLATHLPTIRARCRHEYINNGIVKGLVGTYENSIVGPHGPTLGVQSDDEEFNDALEQIWREWWKWPDITETLTGPDVLVQSTKDVFVAGDYVWELDDAGGERHPSGSPISLRLNVIHPRRLATPFEQAGNFDIMLGVKRNKIGKPTHYYIRERESGTAAMLLPMAFHEVPASRIIHGFERIEADQVRGLPWLTTTLPVVAELRDYGEQVMEAARMAAALSVLLYTRQGDGDPTPFDGAVEMEGGTIKTLPAGYEATMVTPTQPAAQYKEFRADRLSEIGRPFGMPLLTVALNAQGHSWSSARLDRSEFQSTVQCDQGSRARVGLNRLVDLVRREAELRRLIPVQRDVKVNYAWTWPIFESIDQVKDAKAATERLNNGTSTLRDERAAIGKDPDEVKAQRKREADEIRAERAQQAGATGQAGGGRNENKGDNGNGQNNGKDIAGGNGKTRNQRGIFAG